MKKRNIHLSVLAIASFFLQFLTFNCYSSTSVPAGNVSGTWTLAGSPYNIQGHIQISDGTTLIIEPGVTVNFQGTYKLNVQGRLLAVGTATDTIVFTAANITNGWRGIRFDNTPATNDSSKIVYCKLQYGKANGSDPYNKGGALYFNNFSKVIILNCNISNCSAYQGGGIYCISSSPIISYNSIANNSSGYAGGIYCENSSPTISNNIISSNNANILDPGGGIYTQAGSPYIFNNIITNNTAFNGGGIYCTGGNQTIINNIICNNTASATGGGISCENGSQTIINNIVCNNTADGCGGGISLGGSNSTTIILNSTFANNNAQRGGALSVYSSVPVFRNCVFYGNNASSSGPVVFLYDETSTPNFFYCDVQGGTSAFDLNGNTYTGTYQNNIDIDPLFVSPSAGSGASFNGIINQSII